jgi:hypothetical protein
MLYRTRFGRGKFKFHFGRRVDDRRSCQQSVLLLIPSQSIDHTPALSCTREMQGLQNQVTLFCSLKKYSQSESKAFERGEVRWIVGQDEECHRSWEPWSKIEPKLNERTEILHKYQTPTRFDVPHKRLLITCAFPPSTFLFGLNFAPRYAPHRLGTLVAAFPRT